MQLAQPALLQARSLMQLLSLLIIINSLVTLVATCLDKSRRDRITYYSQRGTYSIHYGEFYWRDNIHSNNIIGMT